MIKNLCNKVFISLKTDGFLKTFLKTVLYPSNIIRQIRFNRFALSLKTNEERFNWIYCNNFWRSDESRSGTGSTFEYTANLRKHLPGIFKEYSIKTVFDAPCGDFNWMRHVVQGGEVSYIGGDIVKPLVDELNRKYRSDRIVFIHFDLVKQVPPDADLMICRDCLFHLSFDDARSVLENFSKSNVKYLLTTTHANHGRQFVNKDISTGDFRLIDLFSQPFSLPAEPLLMVDDWISPDPERRMCLWSASQILTAMKERDAKRFR